jgi:hypothetical protein
MPELEAIEKTAAPSRRIGYDAIVERTTTMPSLTARSLKCTIVLGPREIADIGDVGTPRVVLHVAVDGRNVTADIAAKSLRKAQATISEHGADGVAVISCRGGY